MLAFPGIATASTPSLTLNQGNGTQAGAYPYTMGIDANFAASSAGDAPSGVTFSYPSGLLANALINNGACLGSSTASASCQLATGTATFVDGSRHPVFEDLVAAPNANDLAGLALLVDSNDPTHEAAVAEVTVRPADAGLDIAFRNLSAADPITELNLSTINYLRLPTSCPSTPANVTVEWDTQSSGTTQTVTAPLSVTGCSSVSYSPKLTANVNAQANGGAEVLATITQAATEAPSKTITVQLPSSITPNLSSDISCVTGTPCQIGTASAVSPLAPSQALASGTIELGGSLANATVTIQFPPPFNLTIQGAVSLATNSVTFTNVPDVPITSLILDISRNQAGYAFDTSCAPSSLIASLMGQGGQTVGVAAPITYTGCPGPPTASSALGGLGAGRPVLKLHVTRGSNAAKVAKVAIALGRGLSFSSAGLVKKCTGHGHHRRCKIVGKGLSISGAKLATIKLRGGKLVLAFKHAVSQVTITIRGPLLVESRNLRKKVRRHEIKKLPVTVKVYDLTGRSTAISLHPRA